MWPERCLVPLPDGIPDDAAPLLEPFGVALHAIDLASLDSTMSVAVVGCGPIGLLILRAVRAVGVTRIQAIEPLPHRRRAAEEYGAAVEPTTSARNEFDVVFDAAGNDSSLADSLETVRPGGRIVLVGIPDGDRTTLTASRARRKEVTLVWCRRMVPGDLARAVALADSHSATLLGLVSHRFDLDDVNEAFATLADRRGLKVIVTPHPTRRDMD